MKQRADEATTFDIATGISVNWTNLEVHHYQVLEHIYEDKQRLAKQKDTMRLMK